MTIRTSGLHHVTAIAGDPQHNVDFYLRALGLRLVKTTVNFDDPGTYHLYYGDEAGTPGSLITFFPWKDTPRGRLGNGQATTTSFSVPERSLGWWRTHFATLGIDAEEVETRSTEDVLTFRDPDGLVLALVAHHGTPDDRAPWDSEFVPAEHAIRGLHSVTLSASSDTATSGLLVDGLGLRPVSANGNRLRFAAGDGGPGALVDLLITPGAPAGRVARGTVHHVAWRAPDETTQVAWRDELIDRGERVTDILDRQYFRSIYFREPAGTLLEIATDNPGFAIDEPLLELGRTLKLPPWLEPTRRQIAAMLPELKRPTPGDPASRGRPEKQEKQEMGSNTSGTTNQVQGGAPRPHQLPS